MKSQRPGESGLSHAVEERDQHDRDGKTANPRDLKTPDMLPDQIAADDPEKAQKLT